MSDPEVTLQVRADGKWIVARVKNLSPDVNELGRVTRAACDADREVYEDFLALMNKSLKALVEKHTDHKVVGFNFKPPQS